MDAVRNIDLRALLKPYEDQWVALSFDHRRVLGAGKTLREAKRKAEKKTRQRAVFIKLPPYKVSYVPATL